jgi:uncharacterized membrane protein
LKILLVIALPVALAIIYYALLQAGLRRQTNYVAERLLWVIGVIVIIAIVLLATGAPGSAPISGILQNFLNWLHT